MSHAYRRPVETRTSRSHAAIPVAVVLLLVGVVLGSYTLLVPLALGATLVASGFSLLSSRVNPLSASYYSTRKAAWSAVGVVFLAGLALLADAYYLWQSRVGGVLPHL